jgi:DNA (cytosine-5)-methyltransferase 1
MTMTAATLFSGIGAPETAMPEWCWEWSAEIDRFPSAVLAARHPASINLGNVNAHDFCTRAAAVARPDVLVFGSPCQSYSIAGRRLGLDDPRGNLALVALRIVARLEPRWFVFENVPGLLSSSNGQDFGIFLRTVDELGYSGTWAVLDAQWFGVAQRRERLFFVGHSGDWRYPAAVLLEPESLCGNHPPSRQPGERASVSVAPCLRAGGNETGGDRPYGTDVDTCDSLIAEIAPHDRSHANAGVPPAVTVALRGREGGGMAEMGGECATALLASQGGGDKPHVLTSAVRRLTPRECERLMGLPDDYTLVAYRGKPAADGPRYKALGNSMAVPVMRWILSRIEEVHS